MRIAVTGASGFIGSRLVRSLTARGHSVTPIQRLPAHTPARFEWAAPEKVLDGADAVIHLAAETLAQRWSARVKERIRATRVEGTQRLVEAMLAVERPPLVFLSASAIGIYGSRGDEILTEHSRPGDDFLASVCLEWENAARVAAHSGVRVILLRSGMVLRRDGGALKKMLLPFRLGLGGVLGSGEQWMSWIHFDDLAALVHHALSSPHLSGPLNATAPNPVTNALFTRDLAEAVGRPAFLPVPYFALRLLYGEMAGVVMASQRVVPEKAEASGFRFRYPHLAEALGNLLQAGP